MPNHLYYGDNLSVLRDSIATASVDLVYLDPQHAALQASAAMAPGSRRQRPALSASLPPVARP